MRHNQISQRRSGIVLGADSAASFTLLNQSDPRTTSWLQSENSEGAGRRRFAVEVFPRAPSRSIPKLRHCAGRVTLSLKPTDRDGSQTLALQRKPRSESF